MRDLPLDGLFSRERLAGYDPAILGSGRIALVGAGALGQNAALCLALSGVGEIAVVDFDVFEESNRTRSPFFVSGAAKAAAVAHGWLRLATAPSPKAWVFIGPVQAVGDLLIRWADVVVAAVDKRSARAYLAERCRLHRRPLIEAGFSGRDLSLSVYANRSGEEPCWRCDRDDGVEDLETRSLCSLYAATVEAAGAVPAVQAVAQTAGALAAEAGIAALHGEVPLAGRRVSLDLRSGRSVTAQMPQNPDCAGVHAPLLDEPLLVDTSEQADLAHVLDQLSAWGPNPEITLPSPFASCLPCSRCGSAVPVAKPRWAVTAAPTCPGACASHGCESATAAPITMIDAGGGDLLALPPATVGLSPGAVFPVAWSDGSTAWCRLPGDLPSLFDSVASPAGAVVATFLPSPERGPP